MTELFDKKCDIVLQLKTFKKEMTFIHCFQEFIYFSRVYIVIATSKKNDQSISLYLHDKS